MEDVIDAIWNDAELQLAIGDYGEWNWTELDKVFRKVKAKHLKDKGYEVVPNKFIERDALDN